MFGFEKLFSLEREYEKVFSNAPASLQNLGMGVAQQVQRPFVTLSNLIEEATTLHPVTYQRLELLGDAVLGYFLRLNVFAKNTRLKWDHDDIGDIISLAASTSHNLNSTLNLSST